MVRNGLLQSASQMSTSEIKTMVEEATVAERRVSKVCLRTLLMVPITTVVAVALHWSVSKNEPADQRQAYFAFLNLVLGAAVAAALVQAYLLPLQRWMREKCPLIAATMLFLCVWELITTGFRWLPMPYFPGPEGVLASMIVDRVQLLDATWHSLILLLAGYSLGVVIALITSV